MHGRVNIVWSILGHTQISVEMESASAGRGRQKSEEQKCMTFLMTPFKGRELFHPPPASLAFCLASAAAASAFCLVSASPTFALSLAISAFSLAYI